MKYYGSSIVVNYSYGLSRSAINRPLCLIACWVLAAIIYIPWWLQIYADTEW